MRSVSNAYLSKMNDNLRSWKPRVTIDGIEISGEITNLTINQGSCGTEAFKLGAVYIPYITATLTECTIQIKDRELFLEMGLVHEAGEVEYIPIGYFTAKDVRKDKFTTNMTAYGRLATRGGQLYVSELAYPAAVADVIAEIEDKCGIEIITDDLDTNVKINKPLSGLLCREALLYIAGLFGGFCTETSDGKAAIKPYTLSSQMELNDEFCYEYPSSDDDKFKITGVEVEVTPDSKDEDGNIVSGIRYTSDTLVNVKASNPYMTDELFEICQSNTVGLEYIPTSVKFLGDIRIEPWDTLSLKGEKEMLIPCMNICHTWDGGLVTVVTSAGQLETGQEGLSGGPLTKLIERAYSELATVKLMIANRVKADELEATVAKFGYMTSNQADIKYATIANLNAANAEITSLKTSKLDASSLSVEVAKLGYARISELNAANADIEELRGEFAEFEDLNAENFETINADISNIKSNYVKTSTLEADYTKTTDLVSQYATITSLNAAKAMIADLDAITVKTSELESTVATFGYLKAATAENKYATIENLNATDADIEELRGEYAAFKDLNAENFKVVNADIEKVKSDYVKTTTLEANYTNTALLEARYAKITDLNSLGASIESLESIVITTNNISAEVAKLGYATISSLKAEAARITDLESSTVKADELEATVGTFGYLKAETAESKYATIENLNAANANISNLSGNLASYKTTITEQFSARDAEISLLKAKDVSIEKLIAEKATITQLEAAVGRIEELDTDTLKTKDLSAEVAKLGYLKAETASATYATITNLNATNAAISTLSAKAITTENLSSKVALLGYATVEELEAVDGKIDDLASVSITTGNLSAKVADLGYLKVAAATLTYATVNSLNATNANVKDLQTDVANIKSAYMDEAEVNTLIASKGYITNIETQNLLTGYATIDLANVKAGSITTAMIGSGVVGTAQIADGSITDAKIVGLTANKITAGKLDAAEIEVVNLNAANITVGTINGKQIASGAIDTSKLTSSLNSTISTASSNASQALSNAADAQATAETVYDKVTSKGEQLVVNGNGLMGDNTNFSAWTFDGSEANGSPGSFTYTAGKKVTLITDEFFPVNPASRYTFSLDIKTLNGLAKMYSFINFYDVDKQQITASQHMYVAGSTTTLAKDLKSGDKVIYVTDLSGWVQSKKNHQFVAIWNYTNSFGYTYPPETYTRNRITLPATNAVINDGVLDFDNNTITLTTAYSGTTVPAGTYVSQGGDGSTYKYTPLSNVTVPAKWTSYSGIMNGTDYSGANKGGMFPPGTAYAKVGFLWNYNTAADQIWVTNLSVTDTTAADNALSKANSAVTAASAAQTTADGKNTVFYQASAPSTSERKTNDIWFDTDDGNKMYYWNGSAWTAKQFGTNAIANASITNALIADATIQSAKIAALDAGKITTGTLSADRIAASSITAAKIATGAITTDKLGANVVTTAKLAAGAVTATAIAADAVTSEKIATGAVVADSIASSAVTTDKIVASAVTADKIAANAINANKIAAGAVTADKISVTSLQAISARIGGFNIGSTYLANNTTTLAGNASSVYVGTNGISCGTAFKVDNKGALTATNVDINGSVEATHLYVHTEHGFNDSSNIHRFTLTTYDTDNGSAVDLYGFTLMSQTFASASATTADEYVILGLWDTTGLHLSTTGNAFFEVQRGVQFIDKSSDSSSVMNVLMPLKANSLTTGGVTISGSYTCNNTPSGIAVFDSNNNLLKRTTAQILSDISAAPKKSGVYYVVGTGATAGTWTGSCDEITEYYDGLTIAYKINVAGASTTTLNINGLGAKTVRRNAGELTTHLPVNTVVILVYTTISGTGYWVWADYSVNYAYVRQYYTTANGNYPLLTKYDAGIAETTSYVTKYTRYSNSFYINPSTGKLTAPTFVGALEGNANSATTLTGLTATVAELNYCDGVTSNIQTQLNGKAANGHTHSYLPLSGGTLTGELLINTGTTQSATKGIKWSAINSKNPYIGYATDQTDGTFVLCSLLGTTYATGLAIGGGSGNLLYKGNVVLNASNYTSYCAKSTHNHAASEITSGTLAVARGGTGVASNPSMLIDLGSTSAANVFAASPRPGITGILGIGNGGTGATTVAGAVKALCNDGTANTAPAYVMGFNSGYEDSGYTSIANLRSAMGITDYVVEQGTSGIWTYRKWNSGVAECWGATSVDVNYSTSRFGGYEGPLGNIALPSGLFTSITSYNVRTRTSNSNFTTYTACTTSNLSVEAVNSANGTRSTSIFAIILGTWK